MNNSQKTIKKLSKLVKTYQKKLKIVNKYFKLDRINKKI